jgi:hypothetical protein
MLRILLASLAGLLAAGVLAATAAAQTTYALNGIEVNEDPATFVGSVAGGGTWWAVVQHDTLNKTGTTDITGGSFAIYPYHAHRVRGTITGGELVAGAPVAGLFGTCRQDFALSGAGDVAGGGAASFSGTLRHFGTWTDASHTECDAFAASVHLDVTIS